MPHSKHALRSSDDTNAVSPMIARGGSGGGASTPAAAAAAWRCSSSSRSMARIRRVASIPSRIGICSGGTHHKGGEDGMRWQDLDGEATAAQSEHSYSRLVRCSEPAARGKPGHPRLLHCAWGAPSHP